MALKQVMVTKKNVLIGDKVVRGRDWVYPNYQDEDSDYGTITNIYDYGIVEVVWQNKHKNTYRIGDNKKYDLYFYTGKLNNSVINRIGHLLIEK